MVQINNKINVGYTIKFAQNDYITVLESDSRQQIFNFQQMLQAFVLEHLSRSKLQPRSKPMCFKNPKK